jgi:hypothetical protein
MSPIQAAFYLLAFVICVMIWLGGGKTERTGAAMYLAALAASLMTQGLWFGNVRWAVAVIDVVFLAGLIYLALRKDRWWPLVAAGFQILILLIYAAMVLRPELGVRSGVGATWALAHLISLCLLGGVLERFLAGEVSVRTSAIQARRRMPAASTGT